MLSRRLKTGESIPIGDATLTVGDAHFKTALLVFQSANGSTISRRLCLEERIEYGDCVIVLCRVNAHGVKLAIHAPKHISIGHRSAAASTSARGAA